MKVQRNIKYQKVLIRERKLRSTGPNIDLDFSWTTKSSRTWSIFRQRRECAHRNRNGGSQTAPLHISVVSSELSPQSLSPSHMNLRGTQTELAHSNSNGLHERRFGCSSQWTSSDASGQSLRRSHQRCSGMQVPSMHWWNPVAHCRILHCDSSKPSLHCTVPSQTWKIT